ncbi:hypothetical protein L1987_14605 [Smallanthus sonchifolius]|uniref:Uncharacterized protein n=1 Tax=Smallanthus sonchifolius TaxID=185202 RepID=A0ACB9J4A5_9ASTR|nr:hypothetical protein L1987_14605 [Smallanthus sonchifolius]
MGRMFDLMGLVVSFLKFLNFHIYPPLSRPHLFTSPLHAFYQTIGKLRKLFFSYQSSFSLTGAAVLRRIRHEVDSC